MRTLVVHNLASLRRGVRGAAARRGTLLLGRKTYMGFKGFWPPVAGDPEANPVNRDISRRENEIDKEVVSDTLEPEDTDPWRETTRIVRRAKAHDRVTELKEPAGGEILMFGSRSLWNDLLAGGLAAAARGAAHLGGLRQRPHALRRDVGRDESARPIRSHPENPEKGADMKTITPCLWFDTEGEDAAEFYTSVFPNSKIVDISRYGSAGPRPEGTVMTVSFELNGEPFIALNGGPDFTFNEAVSFEVLCEDQDEVDHYWEALTEGGEEGPCGWLKDRFGLSWQIVPTRLYELLKDPDREKSQRAMEAMLGMKKIEIEGLERAAAAV